MKRFPRARFAPYTLFGLAAVCGGVNASASTLYYAESFNYVDSANTIDHTTLNGLSATGGATLSSPGNAITESSSASLAAGTVKVLNSGTVAQNYGFVNVASVANFGDTITAAGSPSGKNLGVNITLDGSTSTDNISADQTFLWVMAYTPGTFNTIGVSPYPTANILFSAAYTLGTDSANPMNVTPDLFCIYNCNPGSITHFDNSTAANPTVIPLSIPFSVLQTNFDLFVSLESYQVGPSLTWTNDYSQTVSVALAAPTGVNLYSASGVLPGTTPAPTPEPSTGVLAGLAGMAGWVVYGRRRTRTIVG